VSRCIVVWAEGTRESTRGDFEYGLGKATIVEVINFCLKSKSSMGNEVAIEEFESLGIGGIGLEYWLRFYFRKAGIC
jgi:hypothetical protein